HVPPAPNSSGTTKGLKVTVNKSGQAVIAAVSLYPKNQSFSNNFALKFDLFTSYSGDLPFGDGGSTEFTSFGIDHTGTEVNWPGASQNGDGDWFSVDADGGASLDFRAFVGNSGPGPNLELLGTDAFLDRDNDGTPEQNDADTGFTPFELMYPAPPGQTTGAIGKQWVQVEVRQQNNIISWLINGYLIAQHPNDFGAGYGFTSGNIMLGHQDPYNAELPDEPYENFAIFDNVRVVDLGSSDPLPVLDASASDPNAAEPGADTGMVTITRTGSATDALTVNLEITGTASNGVDYATLPATITFPAGVTSTNLLITPINDSLGETAETVIVTIAGNPGLYDVRNPYAIVTIADDNDVPTATIQAIRPSAYENNRAGLFQITLSNPNAADTVVNFATSGTAVNGVTYTNIGGSILIPAGQTTASIPLQPIDNSTPGDKTATISLSSGSGYVLAVPSSATEVLYDDDVPQGGALFADDFETDSSPAYTINRSQSDGGAAFSFDYSSMGIPPAPHTTNGTTLGLKLQANDTNGVASGITVSPTGKSFTGDYRLRFDLWINYNGPLDLGGSQSTEFFSAGIGTAGKTALWSGGGSANNDGVWISLDGDSGNGRDLRIWKANTEVTATANPGVYPAGSQNAQNTAYYYFFGSDPAPALQQANYPDDQFLETLPGNPGFAWHDVVLTKIGSNITWVIDGVKIAGINATGTPMSTNIFVGFYDPTSGTSPNPDLSFGLVDNLRVYTMQAPKIITIQPVGSNVQIDFTASVSDSASGFTLQSASSLAAQMADSSATITQLTPGTFRAVTPASGPLQFYRIRR
ncbi:MAG TPA: Calx-beta domain-containing protein, partial [Verrucomicrobiae bacterium]|nr:Calx-beta domain-containing protein [Verrucomicrobiae bacterium]